MFSVRILNYIKCIKKQNLNKALIIMALSESQAFHLKPFSSLKSTFHFEYTYILEHLK